MEKFFERFVVSVGNPFAFLILLSSDIPGAIIGHHLFHISLFGVIILYAVGYLLLSISAVLRTVMKPQGNMKKSFEEMSAVMFSVSVVGLIVPIMCLMEMEANIFGFIIFLPELIFTGIWSIFLLYGIIK